MVEEFVTVAEEYIDIDAVWKIESSLVMDGSIS